MSVYMVIESKLIDPEKYDQYILKVPGIVAKHGGKYLVRGGKVTPLLQSGWVPERMIIIEFPSEEHIREWLSSPEYQAIAPLREAGAEIRAVLLEGCSQEEAADTYGAKMYAREERQDDVEAIRKVNLDAFGQSTQADIVDRLRQNCPDVLSLVAVLDDQVVGHILFSPAVIESAEPLLGMGLSPLAVLPEQQCGGVGSMLIQKGLDVLKGRSCPFVIVFGHPDYYPRFGFERASLHGVRSQWEGVPDEAFMILALDENAMQGVSGVARYRSEFDEAA
jgi:putative acetyltransferase